jgi:type II restriction/modification system DNA methylase subunit YeeA
MDTSKLKRFAQHARRLLRDQVKAKMALVLAADSAARRESLEAVKELEEQIRQSSQEQVLDKVAYTWFNRFCALRFMDLNGYNKVRVVSPADESQFQPEILADAKQGHINETRVPDRTRQRVDALLSGQAISNDPQQEAYRLLVVAECNAFHQAMPYLFERISDYTELLMPDDLLSGNSVLAFTREAMTPDACQDVEVIGWLYQFYISEKKDQVFEGLKKNQKITPENIPAATQLFTPHWIVRYLVENSLGRLWMLNHPNSPLAGQMDYYIAPEQPEADFLKIDKPEDIKICDPACGSGHMLTYAFDLLYAIYEEVGTEKTEIAEKILTHNLFGVEIDERAGELAAFALTMKARSKTNSRFFNKGIKPNICVLQKVSFDPDELTDYMAEVGRDLFTRELQGTLQQFADVDNLGSLIKPQLSSVTDVLPVLQVKDMADNLFLANTHAKVLQVLHMAEFLSPRYAVVVANPPYMGSKGMNGELANFGKTNFPISWDKGDSDLFSMFIERNEQLVVASGYVSMITMQSWMFLSSFEALRGKLLNQHSVLTMAHLGTRSFDTIGGEVVSTTAFVFSKQPGISFKGIYLRLIDGQSEAEKKSQLLEIVSLKTKENLFFVTSKDLNKIPGKPIAYWVGSGLRSAFEIGDKISDGVDCIQGIITGNTKKFLRSWQEISFSRISKDLTNIKKLDVSAAPWIPYTKGGEARKWYGNLDTAINWSNWGGDLVRPRSQNSDRYLQQCLTWNLIGTDSLTVRYCPSGYLWDVAGSIGFPKNTSDTWRLLGLLCSRVAKYSINALNPTINTNIENIQSIPLIGLTFDNESAVIKNVKLIVATSKEDWDSFESSWSFESLPLLAEKYRHTKLNISYTNLRNYWHEVSSQMQFLEKDNNRIFIDAYSLRAELTPEVPLKEITLTCNPHYRYGGDKTEEELESLLLADTMREFISYAVGCMFGRYALDKPGLVLANQGETIDDYRRLVPNSHFHADADNVIPMLDGEWFADDVTERFRQFLRVTFGDEHYDENLAFIEQALNPKGKRNYTLRDYMLGEFYADHVKRYKKRPIYWLFSSPKGTFNALIYLHRYRPDTASVVLRYLRDFRAKLAARQSTLEQVLINPATSQGEKTKAVKEIDSLKKQIIELQDYENDTLYPLATAQVDIDLDDGVKVNYLMLGAALKKITGLDVKEED